MIVARHLYHPLPGKSAQVLEQRLLACHVREQLGLQRGRVLRKVRGDDARGEVVWEWDSLDAAAYDHDMDVQAASDEFMAVRPGMGPLIQRMDRVLFEIVELP